MYFDWESLFIQPLLQRQIFEQMGFSEKEVVSRMTKILEAETLIPPLAMAGVGVGGGGSTARDAQDNTENSYVENGYVENYFV